MFVYQNISFRIDSWKTALSNRFVSQFGYSSRVLIECEIVN